MRRDVLLCVVWITGGGFKPDITLGKSEVESANVVREILA